MKIATNPGSIIAACKAALLEIQEAKAHFAHDEAVRCQAWWYRWGLVQLVCSPVDYKAETRLKCLMAIAKHKGGAGVLEIEDPYLSDIGQFLEPWENTRI